MYIVKMKSKTSQHLIDLGCPEWVKVYVEKFSILETAAQFCEEMNKHIEKFHKERIGKDIYYIEEEYDKEVIK